MTFQSVHKLTIPLFRWCLFLCFALATLSIFAEPIPPKPEPARYCNDYASLLSPNDVQQLEYKLQRYYDSTSTQLVVVIVRNLEGMAPWEYAQQVGEKWGVGQKDKDNGLVLLIASEERKIFIATGYGLEDKVTDAQSKRIISTIIGPAFKRQDYANGINAALDRIIELCSGQYINDSTDSNGSISLFKLIIIIILVIIVLRIIARNNTGTNFHRRGYDNWGGPFWNNSGRGGGWFHGGGSSGGFGGGGSFGGGNFGGGGAGGDW